MKNTPFPPYQEGYNIPLLPLLPLLLSIIALLLLLPAQPLQAANKIIFEDSKSTEIVPHERTLLIQLPILEMEKISINNRDPFVSAEIKDPYVINSPTPEPFIEKVASKTLILQVQNAIKSTLSNSLKILGVSSDDPGQQNAALIQDILPDSPNYDGDSRIKYEGQSFTLTLNPANLAELQTIALLAQQEGFEIDLGFEVLTPQAKPSNSAQSDQNANPRKPPSVQIEIKKIDRRTVTFLHKYTGQEFEITFKRDLDIRPDPNKNPNAPNNTKSPHGAGPKQNPPPKI